MHKIVKRAGAGAVLGGSLLFAGGIGIASAAPGTNVDDQLVNLGVGNADFLQGVNVDVASQIAGLLCGTGVTGTAANPGAATNGPNATGMSANETNTNVRDITALANQVDAGQIPTTTCDSAQGVVTIAQNGPVTSPNANNVPTNTPNANTAPATGPNAENAVDQPNGAQPAEPTAPMTPTSGLTPAS
ncbi:MAG TPA: hypothetical protein VF874_01080, partial [Mycobacterium sp.]